MKSTTPRPEFRSSRTSAAILLALFTLASPLSPLFAARAQAQGSRPRPVGDRRAGQTADKGAQQDGEGRAKSPNPAAPQVVAASDLKVTLDDGLGVGQSKRPGETITYTVTIRNTHATDAATNVKFLNDLSANANLTFVNGSVQTQPIARADAFDVLGNVRIDVPAASGLLANDFDPDTGGSTGLTITTAPTTSARGGDVSINTATGAFTYNPPAGYDGADSFSYTVTDATGKTDTATATFTVANMIWFVQTGATACTSRAAGCGRLSNPFSDLQSFQAAQGGAGTNNGDTVDPEAGDNIFLFTGNANYTGPLTLLNTQKLIGQGASDTLQTISGVTVPPHSDALPSTNEPSGTNPTPPTITSAAGGILLANGNTLRGFNVGAVGTAQAKIQGTNFGTLTIGKAAAGERDVSFSGAGRILSLTTGTFDATSGINSAVSTGSSGGAALALSVVAGTLSFAGVTIAGAAAEGISVTGNSSATINFGGVSVSDGTVGINVNGSTGPLTFGNTSVTSSSVTGVQLVNNTGAMSFGDLDISTDSGATGLGANANNSITATSGTIGTTNGAALHVTNSAINLTFDSVSADNDAPFNANGIHLTTTNGTLSVAAGTILGGSAPAFLVSGGGVSTTYAGGITQASNAALLSVNGGHQTGTLTFNTGTLSATNGTGLQFDNADGIYVFNGPVSLNGGDAGVDITNGSAGMFGFANATVANANAGPAFNVANSNPTVNYTGTVSQSNAQRVVQIDNTTGNTVAFNGAVTATNTSTGVLIQNANGGSVVFSALNLGTAGTRLTSNAVSVLKGTGSGLGSFALGTVAIFTNNASGIVATDIDGTVNATGTVNSTNGAAINVNGPAGLTTLGMTFTSVDANGSTHGIRVQDTNGNFTVNGTGTTDGSGGTIQNTDTRGAEFINAQNVTLKNMNFTNANDATDGGQAGQCEDLIIAGCNAAIYLSNVTGGTATFDNLNLTGTMVENGVTALGVVNFKFDNSLIDTAGNEAFESGIEAQNLSGTSTLNNTEIRFSETDSYAIVNTDAAALNLTISNSIFRDTQTGGGGTCPAAPCNGQGGFQFRSFSANNNDANKPTATINVLNSQFLRLRTQAIQVFADSDTTINLDVVGNTINSGDDNTGQIGSGMDINGSEFATLNFNILNNPIIKTRQGSPINITSFDNGKVEGRVNDNGSLANPVLTRGTGATGVPIRFVAQENSDIIAEARRNFVAEDATSTENSLIDGTARFLDARLDLTLDDNTVVVNNGTPLADINLTSGSSSSNPAESPETNILCANLISNNAQGTGASRALRLRISDLDATSNPRIFLQDFVEAGDPTQDAEATWNAKLNTPPSPQATTAGEEVTASLTASAPTGTSIIGGTCLVVDTSADFTSAGPAVGDVEASSARSAEQPQQPLVIPGLMITQPGARPQPQVAGRVAVPAAAQPAPSQPSAVSQPKAASEKSAAAEGSKGGDEKSKKDGTKGGGVATPRAGMFEVTIGTLPAQDEVTITFQATIAPTLSPAAANSVSNQGTLTADGGISKPSDDPQTTPPAAGEGNDATVTPIDKFEPAIDVASNDATTSQGDSVTFTATLGLGTAPGAPAPTGTVDFVDQTDANPANWEVLCNDVAISGATAQCATTGVDAGTRTIAAVYSGDGRYDPATDTVAQTVTACSAGPVVTSEADSGAGSLREAITGACDGATITFNIADADPDVITLTTAELLIDKNLTLQGPGANILTVQRDTAVGTPAFRVFSVAAGKIVALSNITVANGLQDGITFPQNAGGGIFNEAMLTLANVEVTGNTAVGGAGGGVFNAPGATLSIINSTFSGNSGLGGGGIFNNGGTLAMRNSTVSGNSSPADGGGIQTNSAQPVTLLNITVTNNRADSDDNASGTGGGIYIQSGTPLMHNSIVADNYRGAGTTTEDDVANGSFDPDSLNNLIGTGGSGGLITGTNGNLVGVTSPGIGALALNGGPTRTHKLLAGSAALDAGNNCVTTAGGCGPGDPADAVLSDQRFFGRPVDAADADTTATVDIGAVEMRASVQTFADASIPTDSSHTVTDFNIGGTSNLSVTATSDNQTLVPNANIAVNAGTLPSQRTLVVTPAAGQTGTANITVTVTDISSGDSMSDTFQLTVAALETPVVTITADNPDPSLTGQAVTVTFTVTGSAGTPTGNVVITASGGAETCMASVATGQCDITLTAAGNRTLTATYSGDATYAGGTDTEPHAVLPSVTISDATATEASQLMTFTVHLSSASTELVTVDFTTADEPAGPGKAVAGQDYTTTSGQVVFQPGQTLKTISVPVTNDGAGEADETFLVNLTGATNANVTVSPADNQATGTITEANNAGAILISELRTSGPAGAGDSFVEIYNNSDSAVTVQATDASAGWALVASNNGCASDPVIIGVIPNGEVIPARGHYLLAGSAYSLSSAATLNLTFAADPNPDANVGLFTSSNLGGFSSATRLDAVGFFDGVNGLGGNCDLLREGTPLNAAQGSTSQYSFFRKLSSGRPQDTGRSVDDFTVVSTTPSVAVGFNATPALGAPGPENIDSPIQRNDKIKASLIDSMQSSGAEPNSVRKFCSPMTPGVEECDANRSQFGTFSIRRRWTNNTGENITVLRFRLVNVTVGPAPAGTADLRAISSGQVTGVAITGGGTVDVEGTTLDAPTQPLGGGFNSTLSAGTVSMSTPLAPGASVNLQFLLGVQQPGAYVFFVNVEAGPPPTGVLMTSRQSAPAKEGVNKGTRGGRQ